MEQITIKDIIDCLEEKYDDIVEIKEKGVCKPALLNFSFVKVLNKITNKSDYELKKMKDKLKTYIYMLNDTQIMFKIDDTFEGLMYLCWHFNCNIQIDNTIYTCEDDIYDNIKTIICSNQQPEFIVNCKRETKKYDKISASRDKSYIQIIEEIQKPSIYVDDKTKYLVEIYNPIMLLKK